MNRQRLTERACLAAAAAYARGESFTQIAASLQVSERGLRYAIDRHNIELTRDAGVPRESSITRAVALLEATAAELGAAAPEATAALEQSATLARHANDLLAHRLTTLIQPR